MTHEAELAQLLIRMGTERGLAVETVLAEMAGAPLPSFVDGEAVRGSMLEAVETWWRADLEERLAQLRRQFQQGSGGVSSAASARSPRQTAAPPTIVPPPVDARSDAQPRPPVAEPTLDADATLHDEPESATKDPSQALPRDATMIWNTNHG